MVKGFYIGINGDVLEVENGKVTRFNGFENCLDDWEDEDFDFDEDEIFDEESFWEECEEMEADDLIRELLNFDD